MDKIKLICRLCLQRRSKTQSIYELVSNFKESMEQLINKHFWTSILEHVEEDSKVICSKCWLKLEQFHFFYLEIESVQIMESNFNQSFIRDLDNHVNMDDSGTSCEVRIPNMNGESSSIKDEVIADIDIKTSIQDDSNILDPTNDCPQNDDSDLDPALSDIFNMNCDICSKSLSNLIDAKHHYKAMHNRKGYLGCCDRKYYFQNHIREHILWHRNPNRFQCTDCFKSFLSKSRLNVHLRTHLMIANSSDRFHCNQCSKEYSKLSSLKIHQENLHGTTGRWECCICKKEFRNRQSTKGHITQCHTDTKKQMCNICGRLFKNPDAYKLHHQIEHMEMNLRVQCELCGEWFKHKYTLNSHMRLHKEKKESTNPVVCTVCGKMLSSKKTLEGHMRYVHTERKVQCPICDKKFQRQKNLKVHMAVHTGGQQGFACTFCPRTFRNISDMYHHRRSQHSVLLEQSKIYGTINIGSQTNDDSDTRMNTKGMETKLGSYVCEICGQDFFSIKYFEVHHQSEHPDTKIDVQCTVCFGSVAHKYLLDKHMKDHLLPQTCAICGKKLLHELSLKRHMRKVHSDHLHTCAICSKKFNSESALKGHMIYHSDEPLYHCSFCTKAYRYRSNVYDHQKRVHPDKYPIKL